MWICIGTVRGITLAISTSVSPTRARHINEGSKSAGTPRLGGFGTSTPAESLCLSKHPHRYSTPDHAPPTSEARSCWLHQFHSVPQ